MAGAAMFGFQINNTKRLSDLKYKAYSLSEKKKQLTSYAGQVAKYFARQINAATAALQKYNSGSEGIVSGNTNQANGATIGNLLNGSGNTVALNGLSGSAGDSLTAINVGNGLNVNGLTGLNGLNSPTTITVGNGMNIQEAMFSQYINNLYQNKEAAEQRIAMVGNELDMESTLVQNEIKVAEETKNSLSSICEASAKENGTIKWTV